MEKRYYFDTSIWLDFLEKRDEPNMPKGEWATKLVEKIIRDRDKIIFSDVNMMELRGAGYSDFDMEDILDKFGEAIIKVEASEKEIGKSKDLASKKGIPRGDALHALIARDNNSILVTLDHDFKELTDIIKPYRTNDLV